MSPAYLIIIFAVLFAIVMVAISFGYRYLESQRKRQVEGMLTVVSGKDGEEAPTEILKDSEADDSIEVLIKRLTAERGIDRMIQQAGLNWSVTAFAGAILAGAFIGWFLGWFLHPLGFQVLSALVGAVVLGFAPYVYVRMKRTKRLADIESQLPEALDFLARSMRAGHAFSISLEMLGEESPDPLGQEFRVLFNEQNLGAPLETALANFQERVPLLDVRLFVSSVNLQKQTGGNLSEILIRLAHVIRDRFRLRGQVKAASAHGRLTAGVLSVLPIVVMVALLFIAPGYLQSMANDSLGRWLIAGSIAGQIASYFVMRKIVNIKV